MPNVTQSITIILVLFAVIVGIGWLTQPDETTDEINQQQEVGEVDQREVEVETIPTEETLETDTVTVESAPEPEATESISIEATEQSQTSTETVSEPEPAPATAPVAGSYTDYSEEALLSSNATNKIIFFHANWCPSCLVLNSSIERESANIPADVAIFKADYDTSVELRQKHGITTQHSLALVDANGDTLKTWRGSPNLEAVLSQI